MKILFYDCFSGISGDMNLGAMIDLGVDIAYLKSELTKLRVSGYELRCTKTIKKGIEGTKLEVILDEETHSEVSKVKFNPGSFKVATGEHKHALIQHADNHRTYGDIKAMIESSDLNPKVKEMSLDMFYRVAVAEGKIHGKPVSEVHFHEVGAVDSIVDIVGAAICIDYLKPGKIVATPPQLGGGFVKCAHGTFPVPAPATTEILKGIPVKTGAVNSETTTPTGAAILASLCSSFSERNEFTPVKIAYGIGHKDFDIPNVLRVILAESSKETQSWDTETAKLIECNIDDMPTEGFGYIMNLLLEAGADDVFCEPVYMKKNRPAQKISVLAKDHLTDMLLNIIFAETSTLGVRILDCEKKMLKRTRETIETPWGPVRAKYGLLNGKVIKAKPEYDDCVNIASQYKLPLQYVTDELNRLIKAGIEKI
jgi:uncharacterized protein (TIGR00299 family) protein